MGADGGTSAPRPSTWTWWSTTVGGEERLTPEDERLEDVFLKLRILEGVPVASVDRDVASGFLQQGLLRRRDGHLVPTERGMLLLNELVLALAG